MLEDVRAAQNLWLSHVVLRAGPVFLDAVLPGDPRPGTAEEKRVYAQHQPPQATPFGLEGWRSSVSDDSGVKSSVRDTYSSLPVVVDTF